jgi:hypothetical protein
MSQYVVEKTCPGPVLMYCTEQSGAKVSSHVMLNFQMYSIFITFHSQKNLHPIKIRPRGSVETKKSRIFVIFFRFLRIMLTKNYANNENAETKVDVEVFAKTKIDANIFAKTKFDSKKLSRKR